MSVVAVLWLSPTTFGTWVVMVVESVVEACAPPPPVTVTALTCGVPALEATALTVTVMSLKLVLGGKVLGFVQVTPVAVWQAHPEPAIETEGFALGQRLGDGYGLGGADRAGVLHVNGA